MTAADLTFGVEIECLIPYANMNWTVGRYHVGAAIPGFTGWKAMADGSVRGGTSEVAVETVSPVLRGEAGLADLERMVTRLNEMGAKVNRSTGFHVHVGFSGDVKALVRLIFLTAHVEDALFASTGTRSRVGNTYCKSVKRDFVSFTHGSTPTSEAALARKCREISDRYHVLNLTNLLSGIRPTVEFRVFAGTTSFVKMTAYVQVCLGLVEKALTLKQRPVWEKTVLDADSAVRGDCDSETEVRRLFAVLGWTRHFNVTRKFGVLRPETIKASMKELRRLARKFDGLTGTGSDE